MKAAVLHAPYDLRIEETDVPKAGADGLVVRIPNCAVCATDTQQYVGATHPRLPMVMGHEAAGEVVEVGSDLSGYQVGDRLTFWCHFGCFAEYTRLLPHELAMGRLQDHVTWEQGANTQLLCACLRGTETAQIRPGHKAIVMGQGPVGLLVMQGARALGAQVAGVDLFDLRVDMARRLGADLALNAREKGWPQLIADQLGQVDVVFDCMNEDLSAEKTGLRDAAGLLRPGGLCVVLSLGEEPRGPAPQSLVHHQISLVPSYTPMERSRELMQMACNMVADGRVDVTTFITHRMELAQVAEAMELSRQRPDEVVKIMVRI
ncbi:MAG: zinc-binding dehydrogenase [Armatimonadota bacterium]